MSGGHFGRKAIFGVLAGAIFALLYQPEVRKRVTSLIQQFGEDFQRALEEAKDEFSQRELELKKQVSGNESEEEYPNYIV